MSHRHLRLRQKGYIIGYLDALKQNGLMPTDVSWRDLSKEYRREIMRSADKKTQVLRCVAGVYLYPQKNWADAVDNSLDTPTEGVQ